MVDSYFTEMCSGSEAGSYLRLRLESDKEEEGCSADSAGRHARAQKEVARFGSASGGTERERIRY